MDDCEECLVHFPTMKKLAENVGLELVEHMNLHDYFERATTMSSKRCVFVCALWHAVACFCVCISPYSLCHKLISTLIGHTHNIHTQLKHIDIICIDDWGSKTRQRIRRSENIEMLRRMKVLDHESTISQQQWEVPHTLSTYVTLS